MTPFEAAVARVVRAIPRGKTLGYGQVALLAGRPGAARAVVRALGAADALPWWRVIRSDGTVAPQMVPGHVRRLRAEGARVTGRRVAAASRWRP